MIPTKIQTEDRGPNKRLAVAGVLLSCFALLALALHGSAQIDPNGPQQPANVKASPSPTPSKLDFGQLFAAALVKSREEQEKELNERGPQFPRSWSSHHFSMTAFCKAGAPIVVEYELEDGAEASLAVSIFSLKGFDFFQHRLEGEVIGKGALSLVRRDVVHLPAHFGEELQPGAIAVHARIGKKDARFKLHGLRIGSFAKTARATDPWRTTLGLPVSYFSGNNSLVDGIPGFQDDVISGIQVDPLTINIGERRMAEYSFTASQQFGTWAADFRSITVKSKNGREFETTKWVRTDQTNELLNADAPARGQWDGLNSRHRPSTGRHQLVIRAWWPKANGGAECIRIADEAITVKK